MDKSQEFISNEVVCGEFQKIEEPQKLMEDLNEKETMIETTENIVESVTTNDEIITPNIDINIIETEIKTPTIEINNHEEDIPNNFEETPNNHVELIDEVKVVDEDLICPLKEVKLDDEVCEITPKSNGVVAPPPQIIMDSFDDEPEFVCKISSEEIIPKILPMPKKVAMCTSMDSETVRAAYEDVRADTSETQWGVFKFEGPRIVCSAKGTTFDEFRDQFSESERAFGYIRLQTGDELSKRQKFLFVTWVGPSVSVIQRAKMSTDKSIIKNIISNFAVELQLESLSEFDLPFFVESLNKASGANYGTGVREI